MGNDKIDGIVKETVKRKENYSFTRRNGGINEKFKREISIEYVDQIRLNDNEEYIYHFNVVGTLLTD